MYQASDQLGNQLYDQLDDQLGDQLNGQLLDQLRTQLNDRPSEQIRNQLANQFGNQLDDQLGKQLDDQLGNQLSDQLGNQLYDQLDKQLNDQLRDQLGNQLDDQLHSQLSDQLDDQLDDQLGKQLDDQLGNQLSDRIRTQVHDQLGEQFREFGTKIDTQIDEQLYKQLVGELSEQLSATVRAQLDAKLHLRLRNQFGDQFTVQLDKQIDELLKSQLKQVIADVGDELCENLLVKRIHELLSIKISKLDEGEFKKLLEKAPRYVGQWWRLWSGWYAGAEILGVKFDKEKLALFTDWNERASTWCAYSGLCVVSANPVSCVWQGRQLHNSDGPAASWAGGFNLWSINGVAVDEQIVMRPETQTIDQIRYEENEEVKRIRIERFTWERYLRETGAKRIDRRKNDIEGTWESLYETSDSLKVLMCACPSTAKVFALEVNGSVKSCADAQRYLSSGLSDRIISAS